MYESSFKKIKVKSKLNFDFKKVGVMAEAITDEFLQQLGKVHKISLLQASRMIDKCVTDAANKYQKSVNELYQMVFTDLFMAECMGKVDCSQKEIKECQESCNCVWYENKCISRQMPDLDRINDDPENYAESLTDNQLEAVIKLAAYLYHNFDGGGITDNSFDALEYILRSRWKKNKRVMPFLEKVGAPPVDKIRTKLPFPMSSLSKVKPDMPQLISFLTHHRDIICMQKLDGVSAMVTYDAAGKRKMYTRGDGTTGGDISYLLEFMNIPEKINFVGSVRGEIILTREMWNTKYKGIYANARSFVSAQVNSGYQSLAFPDLTFVTYEIMNIVDTPVLPKVSECLKILAKNKFQVVDYDLEVAPSIFQIIQKYQKLRESSIYQIDGLVLAWDVANNSIQRQDPALPPISKVAFKMLLESQTRWSRVRQIEWNISRHGRYVPVAIYRPIYINGVRLQRATAHNARYVQTKNLGPGSEVKIVRSGDVIPQIIEVKSNQSIIPQLPDKNYGWTDTGVDIVLVDIDNNPQVKMARILHFFTTLKVPRLGEKTVEKLFKELHLESIADFTKVTKQQLKTVPRIGEKTATTLWTGIHKQLQTVPLDRYIEAMTVTGLRGIGRKSIKTLFRQLPEILDYDSDQISDALSQVKIPGIGPKRTDQLASGLPEFRKILFGLNEADIRIAIQNQKERIKNIKINSKVHKKKFVLTNFMGHNNYQMEDYLFDQDAELVDKISHSVECVITASFSVVSSKMTEAQMLKIPVYSMYEFVKKYNLPFGDNDMEEDAEE